MTRLNPPTPDLVRRFTEIVGERHAIVDPTLQLPYLREWRDLYQGKTPVVLRPGSTDEVARILALAHEAAVGVVPQAGNTGLVGGQIPCAAGTEIVVSVERLSRIREIDRNARSIVVEAGVALAEVHRAADEVGRLFPLSMASEGSCRIGGNLATNAGGVGVLAYGTARALTLGIEAVLADGRVLHGLKRLEKDNTGFDLKDLIIGSEGTLAIITAACLRLYPKPRDHATAFLALPALESALELLDIARHEAGTSLTAFEIIPRIALDMVLTHIPGTRRPVAEETPWYALIEVSECAAPGEAGTHAGHIIDEATRLGHVAGGTLAASRSQREALWRLREAISEAQKHEGGSIKHDISVPVSRIPELMREAARAVERIAPGARPVPFGHVGDGNIHYNVSQPKGMEKARFLALWEPMSRAVHDVAVGLGGSISAEHGIGQLKRSELKRVKSPVELDLMHKIKAALDPKGILNPGKVL